MAESASELFLPPTLPYPIKIASLDVAAGRSVTRGTRLLSYSYVHVLQDAQRETRYGTWDCPIEGTVEAWHVKAREVIDANKAKERSVISVLEPCKHGMQIGGLCTYCGKDVTGYDYTGFSDASRATIQMTHSANGPTVSLEEAQRIERETAQHLLESRKLSLIVDLDQTIIHATVDPTVGEWINDGEAWETKRATREAHRHDTDSPKGSDDSDSDTDDDDDDDDDECNPNWEALRDVKKFRLTHETFNTPSYRGMSRGKNRPSPTNEGCMYYIKPRPGLEAFLKDMSAKYEMHIYTMGTRAYAEEVCAAIDPEGKIFGGRILSRDESGSLTQKSLRRLFPCDTSMVVIIDDRADVWDWCPNLLKVVPYDFFVGIGDINSTFLPKVQPLTAVLPQTPPEPQNISPSTNTSSSSSALLSSSSDLPSGVIAAEEEDRTEMRNKAMLTQNSMELVSQLKERPLAKKQDALEHSPEDVSSDSSSSSPSPSEDAETTTTATSPPLSSETESNGIASFTPPPPPLPPPQSPKPARKALLKNDDRELDRIRNLLTTIHNSFFTAYDRVSQGGSRPGVDRKRSATPSPYDVTAIISNIRAETLAGVHLLFSSVIPLDTRPEMTEIWRMATMFGAICHNEVNKYITHVVTAKPGTAKVDQARRRGGIYIVWLSWFTDSIALWQRQPEEPYLLEGPPSMPSTTTPPDTPTKDPIISSDLEPDDDEWDTSAMDVSSPVAAGDTVASTSDDQQTTTSRVGGLQLDDIDWNEINDEVEAAMNETDEEEEEEDMKSEAGVIQSDNEGGTDTSRSSTPNRHNQPTRKRLRSVTPNTVDLNLDENLRSPLSKRKRLAAERAGYSKLKEGTTAADLEASGKNSPVAAVAKQETNEEEEEEEDGDDEGDEIDDDFLARELAEEWS